MKTRALAFLVAVALAGCANFEDPEIVLDLRVLGMNATPPEIVAPVNPDDPAQIDIAQLEDSTICALVADPTSERRLEWRLTACPPTGSGRCDEPDEPSTVIGEGSIDDPETADELPVICGELRANGNLIAILMESFRADDLLGFGGITAQIEVRVAPEAGGAPVFGTKRMRYAAQLPADRVANDNPLISGITATRDDGLETLMPNGRCRDIDPLPVAPAEEIKLSPLETFTAREDYVLLDIEGDRVELTENIEYNWHATTGNWQRHTSGGERDPFGNEPQLFSRWTAPADPAVVGDGLDVEMWLVYRDERGGVGWQQSCVTVAP